MGVTVFFFFFLFGLCTTCRKQGFISGTYVSSKSQFVFILILNAQAHYFLFFA